MKVRDYTPVYWSPHEGGCVQQTLVAQHWETHRSLDQRKMWIAGLYLGGVGTVFAKQIHPENWVYLLLFVAGLMASIAILKLHYLSALHIAKAQAYVGGKRKGIIFDFLIEKGKDINGEDETPKASLCIRGLLSSLNLTLLYSLVIFYGSLMCGYLYFGPRGTNRLPSLANCFPGLAEYQDIIVKVLIFVVGYFVIHCFESKLKVHACNMAFYNLSEGFHDLRRPADRPTTLPEK